VFGISACKIVGGGERGLLLSNDQQLFERACQLAECRVRGKRAPPDWHVCRDMFPLISQADSPQSGCPFSCPIYLERGGRPATAPATAPRLFDSELHHPTILAKIESLGYDGSFGLEYFLRLSDHGQSLRKTLEHLAPRSAAEDKRCQET
jgi:hypothetical protein